MKLRIFNAFALAVIIVFCFSCKLDDSNLYPDIVGEGVAMSISDHQSLSPTGGSFTFNFTSPVNWVLVDRPEWLFFSRTSGDAGSTTITVSADVNATRADRVAKVLFRSTSYAVEMTISQECPYLRINESDYNFDWDCSGDYSASALPLIINSNVDWMFKDITVKSGSPSLVHFSIYEQKGKGGRSINVLPRVMNTDKEDYEMTAKLVAVMYDETGNYSEIPTIAVDRYDLRLFQKHLKFLVNETIEPIKSEVSELGDTSITYRIDTETPWKLQMSNDGQVWKDGLPSWMSSNRGSSEAGLCDLVLNWSGTNSGANSEGGVNPSAKERPVHLRLVSTDATMTSNGKVVSRSIEFVQNPYVLNIDGKTEDAQIHVENDGSTESSVNVYSSAGWKLENIPSWMTVTPASGEGNQTVSIKAVGQNLSVSDLVSNNFRLVSQRNGMVTGIAATQDRFKFDLDYPSVLGAIPTRSTEAYPFTLDSSGGWEVSGMTDWLAISRSSSDTKGKFSLTLGANSANPDENNDRTTTLRFISLAHKAAGKSLERLVSVKQRKYSFYLTQKDLSTIPAYLEQYDCRLSVVCSGNWSITSNPTWLVPDIKSGDGLSDVTVVFKPSYNTGSSARTGKIEVKDNFKGNVQTINVSQDGFVFDSAVESFSNIDVINSRSYPVTFSLTAGAPWKIESYDSWVSPNVIEGKGASTVTFTPKPNPNTSKRTSTVRIHSIINNAYKDITFSQNEYEFDTKSESLSFTEKSTDRKAINVVSSGDWKISSAPSWLKLSSLTGGGSGTVYLSADNNVTTSKRSANFTISSTLNSSLSKRVTVEQDAYVFDQTGESFTYDAITSKSDRFNVVSSGSWKIKDCPSWLDLSVDSGTGASGGKTTSVTITPSNNLELSGRGCILSVVSDDSPSLVKKISVSQSPFVFSLSATSLSFPSSKATPAEIRVECSGRWSVVSSSSWITATVIDANKFSIAVSDNTSSERKGTVTVVSSLNNKSLTVSVTQSKK